MWQKTYAELQDQGFTVIGVALEAEGIEPAKLYYEKYGVTFPALVDANYATGFGVVPKTIFVDEHGVVGDAGNWRRRLKRPEQLKPVSQEVRGQWSEPGARLEPAGIALLAERNASKPDDLAVAVELASRYLDLALTEEARQVLVAATRPYDPQQVARSGDERQSRLLGQAHLQLSRASTGSREQQVRYAELSYFLNPSVAFGKQIARIIAPQKFDHRPLGDFDNTFREATLKRLKKERLEWLKAGTPAEN